MSQPLAVAGAAAGPPVGHQRLVDPDAVGGALERAGLRPPGLPPLRLERGWPLPRIPLMLLWAEPRRRGEDPCWWSLHALPPGRLPFAYRRAHAAGGAVRVDELGALVQRFPDDLMLPSLPELAAPGGAALAPLAAALDGGSRGTPLRRELRGYKPARRCSFRLWFDRRPAPCQPVYVKLVAPEVAGEQDEIHRAAGRALVGGTVEPAVPDRLDAERGLLAWRHRPGRSVHELLGRGEATAAVEAAGTALAELQRCGAAWRRVHGGRRELATLALWVRAAQAAFPAAAPRLDATSRAVRRAAGSAPPGPLVPCHRDFYDKQLLVDGGRTVLLDLETACLGEPELDLANFLAHLELRRLQRRAAPIADLAAAFLAAHRHAGRPPEPERLRWYRAGALLRLACVYAFRPCWGALSGALLGAADELLEETI